MVWLIWFQHGGRIQRNFEGLESGSRGASNNPTRTSIHSGKIEGKREWASAGNCQDEKSLQSSGKSATRGPWHEVHLAYTYTLCTLCTILWCTTPIYNTIKGSRRMLKVPPFKSPGLHILVFQDRSKRGAFNMFEKYVQKIFTCS